MRTVLFLVSLFCFAFSVPCTPPTDNKWGQSQGVLEVSPLAEPKCFQGKVCMIGCTGIKCKVFNTVTGKSETKFPAIYYDLSASPELLQIKKKICDQVTSDHDVSRPTASLLRTELLNQLVISFPELKYDYTRLSWSKEDRAKKAKLDSIVPSVDDLVEFYSTVKRVCSKVTHNKE